MCLSASALSSIPSLSISTSTAPIKILICFFFYFSFGPHPSGTHCQRHLSKRQLQVLSASSFLELRQVPTPDWACACGHLGHGVSQPAQGTLLGAFLPFLLINMNASRERKESCCSTPSVFSPHKPLPIAHFPGPCILASPVGSRPVLGTAVHSRSLLSLPEPP